MPPGFAIRPLAGQREVEAYVELQRAVFGSKNMTPEWRARTLRQREYIPDLDLVAAAPDGRLAAFCICWLADVPGLGTCGQVEPLGVHDDFRGVGLGRAILCEGLRRLRAHGAEKIYMETDRFRNAALGLYESAGFRVIRDVWVYRR
jgi:ribosomal protein S18 acetylase RimI-like enzyme